MLNRTLLNGVYIGRERNNRRKHYMGDAIRWTVTGYPVTHSVWNINHREIWTPWETWDVLTGSRSIDDPAQTCKRTKNLENLHRKERINSLTRHGERRRPTSRWTMRDYVGPAAAAVALRKVVKLIKTAEISFVRESTAVAHLKAVGR